MDCDTSKQVRLTMAKALIVGIQAESHPSYHKLAGAIMGYENQMSSQFNMWLYVMASLVDDRLNEIMDTLGTKETA